MPEDLAQDVILSSSSPRRSPDPDHLCINQILIRQKISLMSAAIVRAPQSVSKGSSARGACACDPSQFQSSAENCGCLGPCGFEEVCSEGQCASAEDPPSEPCCEDNECAQTKDDDLHLPSVSIQDHRGEMGGGDPWQLLSQGNEAVVKDHGWPGVIGASTRERVFIGASPNWSAIR